MGPFKLPGATMHKIYSSSLTENNLNIHYGTDRKGVDKRIKEDG